MCYPCLHLTLFVNSIVNLIITSNEILLSMCLYFWERFMCNSDYYNSHSLRKTLQIQSWDFPTEGGDSESYHSKSKAKRVRTTFTEEQLQVLQANFQLDSNPDGQDLERIAQITGLSKRVTQVWFQNSRARQKKHLNTGKMKSSHCK